MEDSIFERCQTDYESIRDLIVVVARAVVGVDPSQDILEEIIGEGWLLAIEMMSVYDPQRGCKLSTYLWQQLTWRLRRYYQMILRKYDNASLPEASTDVKLSTEGVPNSNIYEGNPYVMSPETVYEKMERAEIWTRIKSEYASKVERCLSCAPANADTAMRTRLSRIKHRDLVKLRISVQKMIL